MSTVEKYESKFITSKDYKPSNKDLHDEFLRYRDKYIPESIIVEQAESDYAKIIKYCESKNAKAYQFCEVFKIYWSSIPVSEMTHWMKTHNMTSLTAHKPYYNGRLYAKIFRR